MPLLERPRVVAMAEPSPRRDACCRALSSAGFEVVCVDDEDRILALAPTLRPRPQALVVDANSWGGRGKRLAERLRATPGVESAVVLLDLEDGPGADGRGAAGKGGGHSPRSIGSLEELAGTLAGLRRFSISHPSVASLLERVLDSAPDPILTVNHWGRIVIVNAQVEEVFGYRRHELLGQLVEVLMPGRLRDRHPSLREGFMASARTRPMGADLDLYARRRDGSEFPVEISLSPVEVDGKAFVTATVRDVSDRRRVERALKENTQWLDAIFDASRDGIIVEEQERIIFVNPAYVQLYGYERAEDLLGQHVSVVQAPQDNERMLDFGRRRVAGEQVPPIYEFTGQRRDGSTLDLEASVAVHSIGGRSLIITTVRDISERKRADRERARRVAEQAARIEAEAAEKRMAALYEDASEASRLKDEFLATLSHELRTPLNAMLGWARLLRGGSLDEETQDRALESIERNAQLQAQLVSDILDTSRIITGKLRLDMSAVELVPLIQSGLDSIRPAADAKGVSLEMHVEGVLRPIHADGDRLLQVMWNLLSNAVKFTPSGGKVTVSLAGRDTSVEMRVSDTGGGISPAFLPYVFDRFRQADASTTRVHGGLGLGLAIVRHLVELHGGTVEASSGGEAMGATFLVRLPARPAPVAAPRLQPRATLDTGPVAAEGRVLEGLRVLAVDDEADTRELLLTTLQAQGASVVVAGSAAEAMGVFRDFHPDVVVADIGMPGEDGYSLMRRIREMPIEEGGAIPGIAVTAYAREQDRQAALRAGFQRHLSKPFEPTELASAIAALASGR